ncbi:MAG TPA: type II toxin-antitoxin system Phd/YefM family antitoxin [Methylomirabilota bacterium]|jgi:antitoxin (DNA-binding transcriptional repressor) of toxin-antitoxin stability system|nr:type II toxin-antitoxin system Phd/YefM family antitoxin [Methylomirabilota bacterium]
MKIRASEVGAFEAKTRLSELLREAERGSSFVIKRRGKAIAQLVPLVKRHEAVDARRLLAAFRQIRRTVRGKVRVRALVAKGRRY